MVEGMEMDTGLGGDAIPLMERDDTPVKPLEYDSPELQSLADEIEMLKKQHDILAESNIKVIALNRKNSKELDGLIKKTDDDYKKTMLRISRMRTGGTPPPKAGTAPEAAKSAPTAPSAKGMSLDGDDLEEIIRIVKEKTKVSDPDKKDFDKAVKSFRRTSFRQNLLIISLLGGFIAWPFIPQKIKSLADPEILISLIDTDRTVTRSVSRGTPYRCDGYPDIIYIDDTVELTGKMGFSGDFNFDVNAEGQVFHCHIEGKDLR